MSFVLTHLKEYDLEKIKALLQERQVQYAVIIGIVSVYVLVKVFTNNKCQLPPGPRPWPLLGNLISLSSMTKVNNNFKKWRKKYGDMFTVYLGSKPCVVLTTSDIIKEAFITKGHEFDGRMHANSYDLLTDGGKDIAAAQPGPVWKLQRQIAHSAIRKHASALNLERNLENAIDSFITAVSRNPHKIIDVPDQMLRMTYNFLASVCFGRHFEYDDPWLAHFHEQFEGVLDKIGAGLISDFVPVLAFLDRAKIKMMKTVLKEFNQMIDNEIEEHKESFDPNQTRDLADEVLLQLRKQEESPEVNSALAELEPSHIRQILTDIFFGETGRVTLKNKDNLPYTNAVVHESMRIETVVPIGVPHRTTANTALGKYKIPKGTTVIAHIYGVHRDPDNFENPDQFNPDRWLDENGKFKYQPFKFIPFSMGPRVCVGESLARVDLQVLTAMLFHKYEFRSVDGKPFTLKTKDIQFGIEPVPFKLKLIERH